MTERFKRNGREALVTRFSCSVVDRDHRYLIVLTKVGMVRTSTREVYRSTRAEAVKVASAFVASTQ